MGAKCCTEQKLFFSHTRGPKFCVQISGGKYIYIYIEFAKLFAKKEPLRSPNKMEE